jgi:quercetin dioxygenase-like cupin family protein
MAIRHAQPGERVSVLPPDNTLAERKTSAIFKSRDLEVMRLVLSAGATVPPHSVGGDITLQCLKGAALITASRGETRLDAGELMFLLGGDVHAVRALSDCSLLVTIALRPAVGTRTGAS